MKSLLFTVLIIIPLIACADNDYLNNPEYIEAVNGNEYMQYNTAMNFLNGVNNFPQDAKKALYFFKKSAEQGNSSAENGLGIVYLRGFGTPQDLIKSEYYFKLAAEQGHDNGQWTMDNGQLQLGIILLKKGDSKSKEEAIAWLKKSAEQGNEDAIEKLKALGN